MLSFEERLTALEQSQKRVDGNIDEINHHMTILLGIVSDQDKDIKEIKVSVASIDGRLNAFEQSVNSRFEKVEGRFDMLEGRFDMLEGRFDMLEGRFDTFEQSVNSRFEKLEDRFEKQDEKLDNVVVLLNTLIAQRG